MNKILLFLVLFPFAITAQSVLKFDAYDQLGKTPISQLSIEVSHRNGTIGKVFTNQKGKAYIKVPLNDTLRFEFEHVAYEVVNAPQQLVVKQKDTVTISLRCQWMRVRQLDQIVIKAPGKPDTLFQSNRLSVQDFDFLPDGKLVLLTYPKNPRKETELLLYDGLDVLGELPVKEKVTSIIRDYKGNPHAVSEKNVLGIVQSKNGIQLQQLPKDYYMRYIAPIVDTSITKYFFSNFSEVYPAFEYFTFDLIDSSYAKIAQIEDEFMMELYRAEYKWADVRTKLWAKEKENETGVDAEIWVGASYFTQSIYYKEVYAPMFHRNDSVFVFDHYKNWMYTYNQFGRLLDSVPIFYHLRPKDNGWKRNMLQDQTTGQIYLYYEMDGTASIQRFDCATGNLGNRIELFFKYPENVTLRDNMVYYTYRPFESIQKKYLYFERLPEQYPFVKFQK